METACIETMKLHLPVSEVHGQNVRAAVHKLLAEVLAWQDHLPMVADRLQQLAQELVAQRVALGVHHFPVNTKKVARHFYFQRIYVVQQ